MKIGIITTPNEKGQIVIPKEMREALGINSHKSLNIILGGNGIHIYPVHEVISVSEKEDSYVKLLEKTKGAWRNEKSGKNRQKKTEVELVASQKRKRKW